MVARPLSRLPLGSRLLAARLATSEAGQRAVACSPVDGNAGYWAFTRDRRTGGSYSQFEFVELDAIGHQAAVEGGHVLAHCIGAGGLGCGDLEFQPVPTRNEANPNLAKLSG